MNCYPFVADQAAQHAVRLLCRAVGVSRSGSCAWRKRPPAARAQADEALTERIRQIHQHSRADRQRCGRHQVARLMRYAGLRGGHGQRRRGRTTVPDHAATPMPDRVRRAFAPVAIGAPDRRWLADISSVEGLPSLAVILDGFSRKVVGWATAEHLRATLVGEALTVALQPRRLAAGLTLHSDHGGQSTSPAVGEQLRAAGLLASLGRVGVVYDNAIAEAFSSSLKVVLVDRLVWPTQAAARLAIVAYIEVWLQPQAAALGARVSLSDRVRAAWACGEARLSAIALSRASPRKEVSFTATADRSTKAG